MTTVDESEPRRELLRRGLVAGGLALAGSAVSVVAPRAARADGETLVAGGSLPLPLAATAAPGTATPEGSRADHVHPTTGLAVLSASNTFLAGASYRLPAATDLALSILMGAETFPRFTAAADGTLSWGAGAAAADVVLARTGTGVLNLTGSLVIRNDASPLDEPEIVLDGAAGQRRSLQYKTAGIDRWVVEVDDAAETGANSGSSFAVRCFNDAGTPLRTALKIARDTGDWVVLPAASGTSPRMSIGDDATTPGIKLTVKSNLGNALGLRTDVSSGKGAVDVVVAQASTTATTLTNTFGARLLFQARTATSTYNVAGLVAVRDGTDDSGAVVVQTALAGVLAERMRVTSAGNIGIGTTGAFGGGRGVVGLAFASAAPTTTPSNGGVLYTTTAGLFWLGSAGTVTKIASP